MRSNPRNIVLLDIRRNQVVGEDVRAVQKEGIGRFLPPLSLRVVGGSADPRTRRPGAALVFALNMVT